MDIKDLLNNGFVLSIFKKFQQKLDNNIDDLREEIENIQLTPGPEGQPGTKGQDGAQGPQGLKGDKGIKGDKGDQGDIGPQGPQGIQGPKGDTGAIGLQGSKGEQGEKGDKGDQGDVGPQGLKGDIGLKGDKGDKGDQGDRGEKGDKGDQGDIGPQGPTGPQGSKGDVGDKGDKGDRGEKGSKGDRGEKGDTPKIDNLKEEIDKFFKESKSNLEEFEKDLVEKLDKSSLSNDNKISQLEINIKNYIERNEKSITDFRRHISSKVDGGWGAGGSGGGSVKILDNDDVEFKQVHEVQGDAILIFDAAKQKFVSESITSIMERIRVELEVQYNRIVEVVGNYTYVGEAEPGTATSASTWRIKRVDEDGDVTEIFWANGTDTFDKVWDNKATYTYF